MFLLCSVVYGLLSVEMMQ